MAEHQENGLNGNPESLAADSDVAYSGEATLGRSFYCRYVKRAIDLVISWLALIACLPVLLVASLLLVLETPGSPIFTQRRVGRRGQPFPIFKLRTMHDGADEKDFRTRTLDTRITRLGKFLRQTKIDEIPQLWNVIRGDMSLIGPRPLSADECSYIADSLGYSPGYPGFHPNVLPGLTGLEQIYRIHPSVYFQRFSWNAEYEKHISPALDLKIFVTTLIQYKPVCAATVIGGIFEIAWLVKLLLVHLK